MHSDSLLIAAQAATNRLAIGTIVAIALSPVVAVIITLWSQGRSEKRRAKLYLFNTLIATRHTPITDENVRGLNMIDVLFHDKPRVRTLWHEYFDMLANEGLSNPVGLEQRQKKNLELLQEMAKAIGYGAAITHLDVSRVYYPIGLGQQSTLSTDLTNELLRVLRATASFEVKPRTDPQPTPPAASPPATGGR